MEDGLKGFRPLFRASKKRRNSLKVKTILDKVVLQANEPLQ